MTRDPVPAHAMLSTMSMLPHRDDSRRRDIRILVTVILIVAFATCAASAATPSEQHTVTTPPAATVDPSPLSTMEPLPTILPSIIKPPPRSSGILSRVPLSAAPDARDGVSVLNTRAFSPLFWPMDLNETMMTPYLPVRLSSDGESFVPTVGVAAGIDLLRYPGSAVVSDPSSVRINHLTLVVFAATKAMATDPVTGRQVPVNQDFTADGISKVMRSVAEFPDLVRAWSAGRVRLDLHVVFSPTPLDRVIIMGDSEYLIPDPAAVRDIAWAAGDWTSNMDLLMAIWPRPDPYAIPVPNLDTSALPRRRAASNALSPKSYSTFGLAIHYANELDRRPFAEISTDASASSLDGAYSSEGLLHEWLHTFTWAAADGGTPQIDLDKPPVGSKASAEGSWGQWYADVMASLCDGLDRLSNDRNRPGS